MIHIKKNWTLKEIHKHVFKYLQYLFTLYELKHNKDGTVITKDFFEKNFSKLDVGDYEKIKSELPYELQIINYIDHSKDSAKCKFCKSSECCDCPLPFNDIKLSEFLNKAKPGFFENKYHYKEHDSYADNNEDFELKVLFNSKKEYARVNLHFFRKYPLKDQKLEMKHCIPEKNLDLNDCIFLYFHEELLAKDNSYKCDKCGKTNASKKITATHLPPNLIIQLKRFSGNNSYCSKINYPIGIPLKMELKGEYDEAVKKYKLYGIVHHSGLLEGGHYKAYIKDLETKQSYCFNDERVYD